MSDPRKARRAGQQCAEMVQVEGDNSTFYCLLDTGHDGPHEIRLNPQSVDERIAEIRGETYCAMPCRMCESIAWLLDQLDAARKDSARIDKLVQYTRPNDYGGLLITKTEGECGWAVGEAASAGFNGWHEGEGDSLREAIDNAFPASLPPGDPR